MSEQSTSGGGSGEVVQELRELRRMVEKDIAGLWQTVAELRGRVDSQKAELECAATEAARLRELKKEADLRAMQLEEEIRGLGQAALEREKDFSRRDETWSERLHSAASQAITARLELTQVSDKLATMENINKSLQSQLAQLQGTQRAQAAHAQELANARSRRLLLKLGLVKRCHWEKK